MSGHARRITRSAATTAVTVALAGTIAVGGAVLTAPAAGADPSGSTWDRLRVCESGDNYSINTGNGYYGAYQFDLPTWRSVGGTGYPNENSAAEQDYRALYLYRMRGWEPWECARILGLQDDRDGGSGVPPTRGGPTPPPPGGGAPAWPGRQYFYGDSSPNLRTWQLQMRRRGFPFEGTGYFGTRTLTYVRILQRDNGLHVVGFIGPKTWAAAWTGRR